MILLRKDQLKKTVEYHSLYLTEEHVSNANGFQANVQWGSEKGFKSRILFPLERGK